MAKKEKKSGSRSRRKSQGRADRGATHTEASHASEVVGGFFGTIRRLIIATLIILFSVVVYLELTATEPTELDLRGRLGCSGQPGR